MFQKALLTGLLLLTSSSLAHAKCGRNATEQALQIIQLMMEHQTSLIPEEVALDLGTPVKGTGGSLMDRNYFSALQIYTKGSASAFFQCCPDGTLTIKMINFGTTSGVIKQKTISFD